MEFIYVKILCRFKGSMIWITGFGTESNSYVMLHEFINCQKLKLTANRGSVANTNSFMSIYTLYLDKFLFEPIDYDQSIGVDLVAKNKYDNKIADCEYWYVDLKYLVGLRELNHSFRNVRVIACLGFSNNLKVEQK